MASTASVIVALIITASASAAAANNTSDAAITLWVKSHLQKGEKLTHLRFYVHDVVSGVKNPSVTTVAKGPGTDKSPSGFGMVSVIDDAMTKSPALNSTALGRVQGTAVASSQEEFSLLLTITYVFQAGPHRGSSVSLSGGNGNPLEKEFHELVIVGGTGLFRLARGLSRLRIVSSNRATGDGTFQHSVWIVHY